MIKRGVVAGALALALLTGSGLSAAAAPVAGGPVVLASHVGPLLDSPPPPGGVLGGVEAFLQRLFGWLFGSGGGGRGCPNGSGCGSGSGGG
jgi:hypothetical protein